MQKKNGYVYFGKRERKKIDIPEPAVHNVTIIGCIKTETGWYRLGFDEQQKVMKPLEKLEED